MIKLLVVLFYVAIYLHLSSPKVLKNNIQVASADEIPEKCKEEAFYTNYVSKNHALTFMKIKELKKCSAYYPSCTADPGSLTVSYLDSVEDKGISEELVIVLTHEDRHIKNTGCWGFALVVDDGLETKCYFKTNLTMFQHMIYAKLGFTYRFTVISIPGGKQRSMITTSPTRCQLAILGKIYYKVNDIPKCKWLNKVPKYKLRNDIASEICTAYPNQAKKQYQLVKDSLKIDEENNCKMVLELPKY